MDLERLSIALRPRNSWEAIDLGVRFALSRARPLYAAWFAVTLPVMLLLSLVFGGWLGELSWVSLIMWWLKPAFDRIALHVLSREVFGEQPALREVLHALPGLLRSTRLLAALTWGRFSLARSLQLPVDQLEGLRGKAGRERKRLLARRVGSAANWLTLVWLHLETILWIGLAGLLFLIVPDDSLPDLRTLWQLFTNAPAWFSILLYWPLLLCSLLLEPLYVAGGFALYLKRRTDLEAWDVELQFRQLARQHSLRQGLAALVLGSMLWLGSALTPTPALAADSAQLREQQIAAAARRVEAVMQDPSLGQEETVRSLRWRKDDQPDPKRRFSLPDWLGDLLRSIEHGLASVGKLVALLGRVGGWLLILTAIGLLAWLALRFEWFSARTGRTAPPAELAGFDIRPESLPDDLAASALALLAAGDTRAALSLLFRGSLSRLAHQRQVVFGRGDTEGDCLERTLRQAPALAPYLARLLGCWQRLAYAHQSVASQEVETLCHDWRRTFEGGRA
ncbi:DUF4129 domain-containing protein [Uliginosibacterium paludis]|uniref:DUF4129 domain-containing protein n=1 Tax=Uliginosibacterium paludis TaxID=1615952 RepID=A0ABV2CPN2_9RHOO